MGNSKEIVNSYAFYIRYGNIWHGKWNVKLVYSARGKLLPKNRFWCLLPFSITVVIRRLTFGFE